MCLCPKKLHTENSAARYERDASIDGIDHGEISESDELLFVPFAFPREPCVYIPLADN